MTIALFWRRRRKNRYRSFKIWKLKKTKNVKTFLCGQLFSQTATKFLIPARIILITCLDKERRLSNWSWLQMNYSIVLSRSPEGHIVPLKNPSLYRRKTDYCKSLYAVVISRLDKWRIEIGKYSYLWSRSLCKPFSDHVVHCVDTLLFDLFALSGF